MSRRLLLQVWNFVASHSIRITLLVETTVSNFMFQSWGMLQISSFLFKTSLLLVFNTRKSAFESGFERSSGFEHSGAELTGLFVLSKSVKFMDNLRLLYKAYCRSTCKSGEWIETAKERLLNLVSSQIVGLQPLWIGRSKQKGQTIWYQ